MRSNRKEIWYDLKQHRLDLTCSRGSESVLYLLPAWDGGGSSQPSAIKLCRQVGKGRIGHAIRYSIMIYSQGIRKNRMTRLEPGARASRDCIFT